MLYTEKEKHEIERVKEVFAEHLRQSPDFELLWSDKVGYVWLTIGVNPVYHSTVWPRLPRCCQHPYSGTLGQFVPKYPLSERRNYAEILPHQ